MKNKNMGADAFHFLGKYLGFGWFLLFWVIGMLSYQSYGITWDADAQREIGQKNYEYVFQGKTAGWDKWANKDYGAIFELPLYYAERGLGWWDTRDVFVGRHKAVHIFFLIGAFFFFKLVDLLYDNKLLASIGFLMLVLHPRIYGHSFFNSKDIPFLSMFIIALYMTALAFHRKTILNAILLGVSIALVINLRILGVMIPTLVFFMWLMDLFQEKRMGLNLRFGAVVFVVAALLLYAIWPYLWGNPFGNFKHIFENMSKFRWEGRVLFGGELVSSTKLPWSYIPTWFVISTPVLYLLAGLLSVVLLLIQFFKKPLLFLQNNLERNNIVFGATFLGPVVMVIVLHSVVYDGWRHLFFIYPSFLLLAMYGLNYLLKSHQKLVITTFLLVFSFMVWKMVDGFPNEHVFFNILVARDGEDYLRKQYEMDYWGVSYKQALEHLLEVDPSDKILVSAANYPGKSNLAILSKAQRKRIQFVPIEEATYFMTNYRTHPEDYSYPSFYKIKVNGSTIHEIFKLK